MKTKSMSRKALVSSILALLLCVSMLVGTTFAWFTDEVVTGLNTIAAGNLDVELLSNGTKVESTTPLFELAAPNLWEPGVVVYENLQVANVGTLALQYQMTLNIGKENTLGVEEYKLSDVLQIAVLKKTEVSNWNDRAEVLTVAKANNPVDLADFVLPGELEAGVTGEEQALVIFWEPGDNDNNYNANNGKETSNKAPLSIEIGINLQATQKMSESDSFGNDYDDLTMVGTADELKAALASGESVLLTADLELDADEPLKVAAGKDVTIDLGGNTITTVSDSTGANRNAFDVSGGTLTVKNGTLTTAHTGTNMGWNNSTNVFNVTAGGVLNLENATIENLGGSDMAFAVHMNNWGEVTLNAKNTTFKSSYVAIRVFNSGNDMNNVTLENCYVEGASNALWVHNYTEADFNSAEKVDIQKALLNFNLTGNTYVGNPEKAGPIRLGMTNAIYGGEEILP